MADGSTRLDELIAARKREREEGQVRHTRERAAQADAQLGPRVVAALGEDGTGGWEVSGSAALRRFTHRRGGYQLALTAIQGSGRADLELRHDDPRFASLAKKAGLAELSEDWFLNALEMLATQIADRVHNPRNFV